jgi:hypothetical protein
VADEVPPSKPIKIGGLTITRRAALGTLVVLLYGAGAAFVVGYSNRDAQPTSSASAQFNRCWDGKTVARGTRCSTDYDAKVLFWAFGVDKDLVKCERSGSYSWSDLGYECDYHGGSLRMAVWRTPEWRDKRLLEYGEPTPIAGGMIQHAPGTAGDSGRTLIRYDSDIALLYASVAADDAEALEDLKAQTMSRTEVLYGVKVAPPTPSAAPTQ